MNKKFIHIALALLLVCCLWFGVPNTANAADTDIDIGTGILRFSSEAPTFTYNGQEHKPPVSVYIDGKMIDPHAYMVKYTNNINAGEATVTATAIPGNGYTGTVSLKFTIKQQPIEWNITSTNVITYDGQPKLPSADGEITVTLNGILGSDDLGLNFKVVGDNVNAGTFKLMADKLTGADTANYKIHDMDASQELTINPKPVTAKLSGTFTKVYDGTTAAPEDTLLTFEGILDGDDVIVSHSGIAYNYADAAVVDNRIVVRDISFSGADAANYILSDSYGEPITTVSVLSTIEKRVLTPSISPTELVTKTYDGTTDVPADTALAIVLDGAVTEEEPTATATFQFNSSDVPTADKVIATGITLTGDWGRNYILSENTPYVPAAITPSTPTITFNAGYNPGRYHNGSPLQEPTAANITVTGAHADSVTFSWAADTGSSLTEGKPVNVGSYTLTASLPATENHLAASAILSVTISEEPYTPPYTPPVTPSEPNATDNHTPPAPPAPPTPSAPPTPPTPSTPPAPPTPSAPPAPPTPSAPPAPPTPSAPPAPPVVQPKTDESGGWNEIQNELQDLARALDKGDAKPGETVTVEMNGAVEVPKKVLQEIAGKDINIEFDMGGGVSWTVNGLDIPHGVEDLDLGINTDSNSIPVNVINHITDETKPMQLELSHNGPFGATLHLSLDVGRENRGHWANLYYFDEALKELVFQHASQIDANGKASWPFSHASSYAVVIDEKSHEPNDEEAPPNTDGDKTNTDGDTLFTDVKETDWFYKDVLFVHSKGIMPGTGDTTFSPDGTATRGMIAVTLWKMEGSPTPSSKNPFDDIPADEYYTEAITWANEQGIFEGYSSTEFGPDDPVTREQLAAVFYCYAAFKGYDLTPTASLDHLADKDEIVDWAQDAVKWAVGSELMYSTSDTAFTPKAPATRAQIAAMLHRFIEKYALEERETYTGHMGWVNPTTDYLNPPKTGGSSHAGLWMGLALFIAAGIGATILVCRRKRRKG